MLGDFKTLFLLWYINKNTPDPGSR